MSEWKVEGGWREVRPLLPVVTVEGCIVWFKLCQMRVLRSWAGDREYQFRVLPVSDIWRS